jgi:hypothetical protein
VTSRVSGREHPGRRPACTVGADSWHAAPSRLGVGDVMCGVSGGEVSWRCEVAASDGGVRWWQGEEAGHEGDDEREDAGKGEGAEGGEGGEGEGEGEGEGGNEEEEENEVLIFELEEWIDERNPGLGRQVGSTGRRIKKGLGSVYPSHHH